MAVDKEQNEDNDLFGDEFSLLSEELGEMLIPKQAESSVEDDTEEDIIEVEETADDNDAKGDSAEDADEDIGEDATSTNEQEKSSPLTPYAKFLHEEGILPNLNIEAFDGSPDALKNAMVNEIKSGIEDYKNMLPKDIKILVDNYEAGVPLTDILNVTSNRIRYESIKDDAIEGNEDLQKALIADYLRATTKFSDEKIAKQISKLADLGELETEAKEAKPELIKLQQVEEQRLAQAAKKEQEEFATKQAEELANLKKTITETKEVIPGLQVSQVIKDKLFKNMTTAVATDDYGNPMNRLGYYRAQNPMQTEMILNYIFEITNEFKDWSKLSKPVKSSVMKELEEAASRIDSSDSRGQSVRQTKPGSKDELMNAIDKFNF